jgi:hypothetical protein
MDSIRDAEGKLRCERVIVISQGTVVHAGPFGRIARTVDTVHTIAPRVSSSEQAGACRAAVHTATGEINR